MHASTQQNRTPGVARGIGSSLRLDSTQDWLSELVRLLFWSFGVCVCVCVWEGVCGLTRIYLRPVPVPVLFLLVLGLGRFASSACVGGGGVDIVGSLCGRGGGGRGAGMGGCGTLHERAVAQGAEDAPLGGVRRCGRGGWRGRGGGGCIGRRTIRSWGAVGTLVRLRCSSVTRNGKSLLLTAALMVICIYLFTIIGWLLFPEDFVDEAGEKYCDSMSQVWPSWYARRRGGPFGVGVVETWLAGGRAEGGIVGAPGRRHGGGSAGKGALMTVQFQEA